MILDLIPADHYDEAVAAREAARKARALPRRVLRRAVEEAEAEAEAALEAEADQVEAGASAGPSARRSGIPKSCETQSTGDDQGCKHREVARKCPDCNEAVRCPHGKTRTGRYRYTKHCVECTPTAACVHGKHKNDCTSCNKKACTCRDDNDEWVLTSKGTRRRKSDCVDCSPHLQCWSCDDAHSNPHIRSRCRDRAGPQEKKRREKRKAKK